MIKHQYQHIVSFNSGIFQYIIFKTFIILILLPATSTLQCQINPNCFQGCSDSICIYDPTTNPFYNSSIILANATTYNGPYCCSGCNLGYFLWDDNITCSSVCNVISGQQQYGNPLTRKCEPQCPSLYYGDPTTTKCVTKCPQNYWINSQLTLCLTKCPSTTPYYYTQNHTCLNTCPSGNYTYTNSNNQTICTSTCDLGMFQYDITMACVNQCPDIYYGDSASQKCVQNCPSNTYKQNQIKECVDKCSNSTERYGDDLTGFCVQRCPFSEGQQIQYYGDNFTNRCVSQCPSNSYAHKQILICVQACFEPYPQENFLTNTCQVRSIKVSLSKTQIVIISSIIVGSVVFLGFLSFLLYKFYIKKRLIRKSWTYSVLADIQFTL